MAAVPETSPDLMGARPPLLAVDHSPDVIAVGMSLHQKILEDPDPVDPGVDVRDLSPLSLEPQPRVDPQQPRLRGLLGLQAVLS